MSYNQQIIDKVSKTLVKAGSTLGECHIDALKRAIQAESNANAKWAMQLILENALSANGQLSPLCDDTGIPHLVLDVGNHIPVTADLIDSIHEGVRHGLRQLPGRPMAVLGDDQERIDQSLGLDDTPEVVEPAPILMRKSTDGKTKLHILMFGGGPAIRGRTYRVFHKHSVNEVVDQILEWATDGTSLLGCTPSTLAIGIGRSQYEAASLMLEALVDGDFNNKSEMEQEITRRVNESQTGPLGLGGDTTVLTTFLKVGPQRASGVRIVSLRPSCCYEPRIASIEL